MKKSILIVLLAILSSCTYMAPSTGSSDGWLEREMRPSVISNNGEEFFRTSLHNGDQLIVYYGDIPTVDKDFYYQKLMQDFGWHMNTKGGWSSNNSDYKRTLYGHIYINPARRIAVYMNPNTEMFNVFKVNVVITK